MQVARCCLPAADRVQWMALRRRAVCYGSVACYGVVDFKRGIIHMCSLYGEAPYTTMAASMGSSLDAARAAARRAPPVPVNRSSRGDVLRLAVDYFLLGSFLSTRFVVWSDVMVAMLCTSFFVKDFALRRLKTRKKFWPRRGERSQIAK